MREDIRLHRHLCRSISRDVGIEEIHRRAANETRHEDIGRQVVEVVGRVNLLQESPRSARKSGCPSSSPRFGHG